MNHPVLLVEDSDDDVLFMLRAWKLESVDNALPVAKDGREAMAYLAGSENFADRVRFPLPGLILLDLKLPYVMGLEVLKWMRSQPALKTVPVIILTSSSLPSDINEAYRLGANAFLVKPSGAAQLNEMVRLIRDFWLKTNRFP